MSVFSQRFVEPGDLTRITNQIFIDCDAINRSLATFGENI